MTIDVTLLVNASMDLMILLGRVDVYFRRE